MKCPQCGHMAPDGAVICRECGVVFIDAPPQADQPPVGDGEESAPSLILPEHYHEAEPVAAAAPDETPPEAPDAEPAAAAPQAPPRPPPGKGRGCLMGCLSVLGVVVLLILAALAVVFDLPARMGLAPSAAVKLLSDKPDYDARAIILDEFRQERQPTQGLFVYVLPYKGTDQSLAYVVLDQSKGYQYVITSFSDPISAAMIMVARSKAVAGSHITRVAVEFRETDGTRLFVVTAPVDAIRQYDAKTIDKKQFFARLEGHGNFARIYRNQLDFVRGVQ